MPELHLDEVFSSSMSFNSPNGFFHDSVTPNRQTDTPSPSSTYTPRSPQYNHETPTRQVASIVHLGSPLHSETDLPNQSLPASSTPGSPPSEGNDQWSSAVGRATTGKSGRVIERLMGDNDRLQREIKLATVRLEEEIKRGESARAALDSLRATNENLKALQEADKAALARRDRKIEDLKADLTTERSRREKAENETRDIGKERDEIVDDCRKEVLAVKELARKSSNQYEILSGSWRSLDNGYRHQTKKLKTDILLLRDERRDDQQRIARLDIVIGQLHQESEKTKKAKDRMSQEFEEYKREKEEGMRDIKERAEKNESANEQALREMTKLLGEMKYIINVKRDVKGVE